VSRADVRFRDKHAQVTFDPDKVSVEQLIEAVQRSGFQAAVKAGGATK
jgi:copper chaperone CopZ